MPANISSVEKHIQNVQNLMTTAEKFIASPNADKTLVSHAEKFVKGAAEHIVHAEKMVTSSEQHLVNLSSTAEQVVSSMSGLFGPQKSAKKSAPKSKKAGN